jgi:ABC-type polysaccharide/polyol phosphate export permease
VTDTTTQPSLFREIWRFRYVVFAYVSTALRLRYRRSYLGFLWSVLAPVAQFAVVGFMMKMLLKTTPIENYFGHYFVGAVWFSLVSAILNRGPNVLIHNEHLIKKIYLPKVIFVLNNVCYETTNFLLTFCTLSLLGMLTGVIPVHLSAPLALVGVFLTVFFLQGIMAILGVAAVYFRDLVNVVPVLLQASFFLTPIAFSRLMVPARFQWAVDWNPFAHFLELVRAPMLQGSIPTLGEYALCAILALGTSASGVWVLRRFDSDIVFRL